MNFLDVGKFLASHFSKYGYLVRDFPLEDKSIMKGLIVDNADKPYSVDNSKS